LDPSLRRHLNFLLSLGEDIVIPRTPPSIDHGLAATDEEMENTEGSTLKSTTNGEHSGQQHQRGIKALRNLKRGLEIKRCNLSTGRARPVRAGEEEEVRNAIVELQSTICEIELAGG
jgi:hypothetical protein